MIFILGLMIGSFLNVVIYRIPLGISIVFPRSSCPKCNNVIPWFYNLPLLSYIYLRGRCAFCGVKISLRYPLIELATGLIYFLISLKFPITSSFNQWMIYIVIASIFLAHFFIDLEHRLLLDKLNISLLLIVLYHVYLNGEWIQPLIGLAIGFGFPTIIATVFFKLRGQAGLGGGDIKLFAILGLLLGPYDVIVNIFLSSFVGSIVTGLMILIKRADRSSAFAFGPYILVVATFQIFSNDIYRAMLKLLFSD